MSERTGMKMGGKTKKKYPGEYPARVVNVDDPKKLMRVQVRVMDVFDGTSDKDLPWAEYKLPVGVRPNDGFFTPVDVDDWVWVDFPHEQDTRRPRITAGMHFCPNSQPNLPHESWVGPDKHTHKRTGPQVTPTEAVYHRDVVFTQHGVLVEIVESTGEVRVTQKGSSSAIEIDKEGNITVHSENNVYVSSTANCQFDIEGNLRENIDGTTGIISGGNMKLQAPRIDLN
jgi:hypothetical protein